MMSPRRFWSVEHSVVGTYEGYFRGGSRQMRTHGRTHTPIHGGVQCDIGCAPATRKRSLREDSGAGSLRITAEIPFGSLAADNKVPQLRDDATYRLTPQEHAPHVYSHASPGSRERMPRSRLRELWAGTMGGASDQRFTPRSGRGAPILSTSATYYHHLSVSRPPSCPTRT